MGLMSWENVMIIQGDIKQDFSFSTKPKAAYPELCSAWAWRKRNGETEGRRRKGRRAPLCDTNVSNKTVA